MKRKSEKEIMSAICPEDIFTMDIELIEQEKENYIMDFKPKDYCAIKNYTITRKVLLLYNQAIERLEGNVSFEKADIYKSMSPLFEVTTKGELYQFYENVFEGEVAYIYKGTNGKDSVYLKVAIDSDDNKLIDTEYEVLSELKHHSLPYAKQKIMINDNRAILMQEIKGVTMSELLEQYPKGVPQEHVMWILERLFSVVGYLHSKCVVHGNIKPENIIINKDNHNVSLVGFSFCIPKANTDDAKYKIVKLIDNNKAYFTDDIPIDIIINEQTYDKFFKNNVEDFNSALSLSTSKLETNRFAVLTLTDVDDTYNVRRCLFKVNSLKNNDIEYTGIRFAKEYSKSMFSVAEYKDNIFITGRVLHGDPEGFSGLEIGMYPAEGGDEIQRCRLLGGNQLYCHMTEDATWFSKNLFEYIDHPYPEKPEWNTNTVPGIYKLDYKTQQVYEYNADGSYTILPWIMP